MNKHEQWKASLAALSNDHYERTKGVCDLAEIMAWNELHSATLDAMRDYYFEPAVDPYRVRLFKGARG